MELRTDLRERMNCRHCLETAERMRLYLSKLVELKKRNKRWEKLSFLRIPIHFSDDPEVKSMLDEIQAAKERDPDHWGSEEARKISKKFIMLHLEDPFHQNSGP